jgi:ethanolamine ammonia-lyase large subunit
MTYKFTVGQRSYCFNSLKDLMAKASPLRSADQLAEIAAGSQSERVAAQMCLADLSIKTFLNEDLIPAEKDEVTRLIQKQFDPVAFKLISHHTIGSFRDWLLKYTTTTEELERIRYALTPEMVAAVSKIMRNQDLILVAQKCEVVTKFRNTVGLKGHLSVRLQPNHPTDDWKGIAVSIMDGLVLGSGDAMIGINPASDNPKNVDTLLKLIDGLRMKLDIPTQSCVLTHVTTQIDLMKQGSPIDLVFQSIAGTENANKSFGINLALLQEAYEMARDLKRGTIGENVMYFETGQGSALSAGAHHGLDAQTCETRAYAVAREYSPFLVNSVVGFIGPEYLYDGKQIIRAGLEDHFCAKLLGLPMGCDVCYTNHALADQNDMDTLLTLLGVAGCSYIMGVPGADDVMLNYQSTSFHDALYLRSVLGLRPAPEFLAWLERMKIMDSNLKITDRNMKLLEMVKHEF